MELGNIKSPEMAQFFLMLFDAQQHNLKTMVKHIASQENKAAMIRYEINQAKQFLADSRHSILEKDDVKCDLTKYEYMLGEIEVYLNKKQPAKQKYDRIQKLRPKYAETISINSHNNQHNKIQRLNAAQDKFVTHFHQMCDAGITISDFKECEKLFGRYNKISLSIQYASQQRTN